MQGIHDYTRKVPGVINEFGAYVICPCCYRTGMVDVKRKPGKLIFVIHSTDEWGQPSDVCDIPVQPIEDLLRFRRSIGVKVKIQQIEDPGKRIEVKIQQPRTSLPQNKKFKDMIRRNRAKAAFDLLFSPIGDEESDRAGRPPLSHRIDRLHSRKQQGGQMKTENTITKFKYEVDFDGNTYGFATAIGVAQFYANHIGDDIEIRKNGYVVLLPENGLTTEELRRLLDC